MRRCLVNCLVALAVRFQPSRAQIDRGGDHPSRSLAVPDIYSLPFRCGLPLNRIRNCCSCTTVMARRFTAGLRSLPQPQHPYSTLTASCTKRKLSNAVGPRASYARTSVDHTQSRSTITHPGTRCHNARGVTTSSPASPCPTPSATSPSIPPCDTLDDVKAWICALYGDKVWQIMEHSMANASASAASSPFSSSSPHPPPLLHVCSVFNPSNERINGSNRLDDLNVEHFYTLQVGAGCLTHPWDRFALSLSRALASEVVFTGQVLRDEPHLVCAVEAPFIDGLAALRSHLLGEHCTMVGARPHVSIMTRGETLDSIDFTHPMLNAFEDQQVTIHYAVEQYGKQLKEMLGSEHVHPCGAAIPNGLKPPSLNERFEAQLVDLIQLTMQHGSARPTIVNGHKKVRFRWVGDATVENIFKQLQVQQQAELAARGLMLHGSPFLMPITIEAGPRITQHLYPHHAPTPSLSTPSYLTIPVECLLLSIYSGDIRSNDYPRYLVSTSPTLTKHQLDNMYACIGSGQSSTQPDWSFNCYLPKTTHSPTMSAATRT